MAYCGYGITLSVNIENEHSLWIGFGRRSVVIQKNWWEDISENDQRWEPFLCGR